MFPNEIWRIIISYTEDIALCKLYYTSKEMRSLTTSDITKRLSPQYTRHERRCCINAECDCFQKQCKHINWLEHKITYNTNINRNWWKRGVYIYLCPLCYTNAFYEFYRRYRNIPMTQSDGEFIAKYYDSDYGIGLANEKCWFVNPIRFELEKILPKDYCCKFYPSKDKNKLLSILKRICQNNG